MIDQADRWVINRLRCLTILSENKRLTRRFAKTPTRRPADTPTRLSPEVPQVPDAPIPDQEADSPLRENANTPIRRPADPFPPAPLREDADPPTRRPADTSLPPADPPTRRPADTSLPPADPPIRRYADTSLLIPLSARNPVLVIVLTILGIVAGLYALYQTPLDAIPDLSDVQVIVYTDWQGRSPDLIEDQITYPITTKFIAAPKVKFVRGESMFGKSFVYVIFQDGTDIYWARSRVIEYLNSVRGIVTGRCESTHRTGRHRSWLGLRICTRRR